MLQYVFLQFIYLKYFQFFYLNCNYVYLLAFVNLKLLVYLIQISMNVNCFRVFAQTVDVVIQLAALCVSAIKALIFPTTDSTAQVSCLSQSKRFQILLRVNE